ATIARDPTSASCASSAAVSPPVPSRVSSSQPMNAGACQGSIGFTLDGVNRITAIRIQSGSRMNHQPIQRVNCVQASQQQTAAARYIIHTVWYSASLNMLATGSDRTNSYNLFFCPWSLKPMPLSARRDATPDPYAWMEQRDSDEVIQHLHAENRHTEQWLAAHNDQRGQLFEEIRGRIRETDLSLPAVWGPWLYYQRTEAG